MNIDSCISIEDLRRLAKKKLPRVIYDFIEGGADDEICITRNVEAFRCYELVPRYLVDVAKRDQHTVLLGKQYAHPFGIGPTGMAEIARHGADRMLAAAALRAGIPFILSGASNASIEAAAEVNPDSWLQIYVSRDHSITADMLRRAIDAGYQILVLTVDVPVNSKRERNIRSGWVRPFKPTLPVMLEAMRHPAWVMSYLRHGVPRMDTWAKYIPAQPSARAVAEFYSNMLPCPQDWKAFDQLRRLWPGKFLIKGILHPDDAVKAKEAGADGIIVSNHGGRQLDRSIHPLAMLPGIRSAVGRDFVVIMDSGIRRGADVVIALCLGANFALVGRATLYGVAAAGFEGAEKAIRVLSDEVDLVIGQLGCPRVANLNSSLIAASSHMSGAEGRPSIACRETC